METLVDMSDNIEFTSFEVHENEEQLDRKNFCSDSNARPKSLACEALRIVVQYWMIPDLGWDLSLLEKRGKDLKREIIERIIRTNPDPEHTIDDIEQTFASNAKMNFFELIKHYYPSYFDLQLEVTDEALLPTNVLSVSIISFRCHPVRC